MGVDLPKIGISSCLLGNSVRHNGGHTFDNWIVDELGQYVEFVPFCPEVEMGMGVPREEVTLMYGSKGADLKMIGKKSGKDWTNEAKKTGEEILNRLSKDNLSGVILMKKSPSCGLGAVKSIGPSPEDPVKMAVGIFASAVVSEISGTPIIDSGRLRSSDFREGFVKQIFAAHHFSFVGASLSSLQDFHRRYKYVLMEHDQDSMRQLGKMIGDSSNKELEDTIVRYRDLFFKTIARHATVKNRVNALMHVMGYLKEHLTASDKSELLTLIEEYKQGVQRYVVVLRILEFFIIKYEVDYLKDHYFFRPYPKGLKLQNHI